MKQTESVAFGLFFLFAFSSFMRRKQVEADMSGETSFESQLTKQQKYIRR